MKQIILKFKSEQDYNDFVNDMKEDWKDNNDVLINEDDTSIEFTFEDSEIMRSRE